MPTVILLCIIGGRAIQFEEGAVIVDLSLGVILVFSSLAAIIAPFVYRNFPSEYVNDRTRQCVIGDLFG